MKPAHKAFVVKHGKGSNLDRAARDAIHNILSDAQFKGLRTKNILPMQITLQEYREYGDKLRNLVQNLSRMVSYGI